MEKRYYLRVCRMCGEGYETTSCNTLYCSDKCREAAAEMSAQAALEQKRHKRAKKTRKTFRGYSDPSEYARKQLEETTRLYATIDMDDLRAAIFGA